MAAGPARPMGRRAALPGWGKALALLAAVPLLTCLGAWLAYRRAEAAEQAARSWIKSDRDSDGRALVDDTDADGDGLLDAATADADHDGLQNGADAAKHARSIIGRRTDPLMGRHENVLGRLGFVVCTDVVVESWLAAGVSLPALAVASAREHPGWYPIDRANAPGDPYFVRRVRNYRALFAHHPLLELAAEPRVGDWAFYHREGRDHAVLVVDTRRGGGYLAIEAFAARVELVSGQEVEDRFGTPLGFGRTRADGPG